MFIKEFINAITAPYFLITAAGILLFVSLKYPGKFYTNSHSHWLVDGAGGAA